jgi:hypothetical protein
VYTQVSNDCSTLVGCARRRQQLLDYISTMRLPSKPLDWILNLHGRDDCFTLKTSLFSGFVPKYKSIFYNDCAEGGSSFNWTTSAPYGCVKPLDWIISLHGRDDCCFT